VLYRQQLSSTSRKTDRVKIGKTEKRKQQRRRTKRRKEKSIQRVDSASRRRISQQLPLIPSANTRNLNACGPGASIHGQGRIRESLPVIEGHLCDSDKKLVISLPRFSAPFVIPLVLYAKLTDKKANRES